MLLSCTTARTESALVRKLLDPATRMRALYEMENGAKEQSFEEFAEQHANLRVTVCPQRGSAPPLYIVSHDPDWRSSELISPDDYEIMRPDELFQERPSSFSTGGKGPPRLVDQSLDGFHPDGRSFTPFDGDNMITDGYLLDVNGDGLVEMLDTCNTGVSGGHDKVEVLTIQTAELKPRTLLTVVLNWHARDADTAENRWSWDIRAGTNGTWQVVLFPSTGTPEKPGAVYEWDAARKRFIGPDGGKGSHFARLQDDLLQWSDALEKMHSDGGLAYPVVVQPSPLADAEPAYGPVPPPPPARPYVKQSRKGLSHAELFAFMGPGQNFHDHAREHQSRDRVPEGFWDMAPQAAALKLVEINRSDRHRSFFQLAVDDRDGRQPPETGTLHLSHSSSGCYNARQWAIFISFHPGDSWMACARTATNGAATHNALRDGVYYDFSWHELKDADARHLAHTVWWLDRVRSRDRRKDQGGSGMSMSTADGFAQLKLQPSAGGKALVDLDGTVFSNDVCLRWNADYNKETALNFACLLIEKELPSRWGGSRDFLHHAMPVLRGWQDAPPDPTTTEKRRQEVRVILERFLERLDHPPALKPAFIALALEAAAETGVPIADVATKLETRMHPPSRTENELRELERRVKAAGPRPLPSLPDTFTGADDPFGGAGDVNTTAARPKQPSDVEIRAQKLAQERLDDELRAHELRQELEDDLSFMLRNTLPVVRRKLAARDDVAALKTWALAHGPEAAWAMRRLRELDLGAYVDVLSTDLLKLTSADEVPTAVALFEELCDADINAATRLLPQMKGKAREACAVIAPPVVGIETDVDHLVAVLADPKTGDQGKRTVIDKLVPPDDPMRHRDPRIEKALLKEMKDQAGEFAGTGRMAAEALTKRDGAIRHWEAFNAFHQKEIALNLDANDYLCRLVSGSNNGQHLDECRTLLVKQLHHTNSALNPVFAAIYVLNLRDTASELERVATFDGTDVEGREARTAGGQAHAVTGRFHLPRQILAVWNEPDPTTITRMLIAWSVHHASEKGLFRDRVEAQVNTTLATPGVDRAAIREFLDWCVKSAGVSLDDPIDVKAKQMLEGWRQSLR